jgi:DeoR family suf operon transcriptional repressor
MSPTAHPALTALPLTRRAVLNALKKRGEMTAEELADILEMTVSGVRQQLTGLQRDGLVAYEEIRSGPGRPRHSYRLTPAADALYPRAYAELTNELLQYIEDADPEMVDNIFERRRKRRIAAGRERLDALPYPKKVTELAKILDEDGYLADWQECGDGTYLVTERNCAIFGVAMRYGQACGSELEFIRAVLPDARVERIAHMVAGAHNCSYRIEPQTS